MNMAKLMKKSMSRSNTKDDMYKNTLIPEYREAITLAKVRLQGRRCAVHDEEIRALSSKLKNQKSISRKKASGKDEFISDHELYRMFQAYMKGRRQSFAVSHYD